MTRVALSNINVTGYQGPLITQSNVQGTGLDEGKRRFVGGSGRVDARSGAVTQRLGLCLIATPSESLPFP